MTSLNRLSRYLALGIAAGVALAGATFAQEAPPIPKEVGRVTAQQLKKMIEAKEKFLLIDSRNPSEYKEGHYPGAISVYDKDMEANKAKFPADKNTPLVFYCNGFPKCPRSLNGAKIALGWGYKRVSFHIGGMPEWEQLGYPVER
jgi:rhodanese-related sulfurtransferase